MVTYLTPRTQSRPDMLGREMIIGNNQFLCPPLPPDESSVHCPQHGEVLVLDTVKTISWKHPAIIAAGLVCIGTLGGGLAQGSAAIYAAIIATKSPKPVAVTSTADTTNSAPMSLKRIAYPNTRIKFVLAPGYNYNVKSINAPVKLYKNGNFSSIRNVNEMFRIFTAKGATEFSMEAIGSATYIEVTSVVRSK